MSLTPAIATRNVHSVAEGQYKNGILLPLVASSAHLCLYGFNVMLFRVALTVLRHRRREGRAGHRLFLFSVLALFALSSLSVPVSFTWDILATRGAFCAIAEAGQEYVHQVFIAQSNLELTRVVILLIITLIIDSILVFRCFVICRWRKKKYAAALLILASIFDIVAAVSWIWDTRMRVLVNTRSLDASSPEVSILNCIVLACVVSKLLLNLALTSVIARTILRHEICCELDKRTPKRFKMIARMMLESCLLNHAAWIVSLVLLGQYSNTSWSTLLSILIQLAGISPTLLIVRASTQDEEAKEDSACLSQNFPRTNERGVVVDLTRSQG
ncbi:hypothetical protein PM082_009638 [Marasmius tenuissimus]|nr:hypothetical protein PM082_009638 [Marasmius tenuissimus]